MRPFLRRIFFYDMIEVPKQERGENRMKKTVNKEALVKEATYWNAMKQLAKQNPGTVCRK